MTKKWFWKGSGTATKPSPRICIDNKPQDSGSYLSIVTASNDICLICGGDHNVLMISLKDANCIVTLFTIYLQRLMKLETGMRYDDDDKYHQHKHCGCNAAEFDKGFSLG